MAWDGPARARRPIRRTGSGSPTSPTGSRSSSDALGLERPHVAGISLGGALAIELYRRHPDLPRTLVLASGYAGWAGSLPPAEDGAAPAAGARARRPARRAISSRRWGRRCSRNRRPRRRSTRSWRTLRSSIPPASGRWRASMAERGPARHAPAGRDSNTADPRRQRRALAALRRRAAPRRDPRRRSWSCSPASATSSISRRRERFNAELRAFLREPDAQPSRARYHSQAPPRPSSSATRGSQPSSLRIAVESRNWRSISACGTPAPRTSGSTLATRHRDQPAHQLEHGHAPPPAGVPGTAAQLRPVQRGGDRQVGVDGVVDVEVVALGRAVRADHGPLAAHERARRVGHEPRPVHVARAVDVGEARDRHRQRRRWRRRSARSGRRTPSRRRTDSSPAARSPRGRAARRERRRPCRSTPRRSARRLRRRASGRPRAAT